MYARLKLIRDSHVAMALREEMVDVWSNAKGIRWNASVAKFHDRKVYISLSLTLFPSSLFSYFSWTFLLYFLSIFHQKIFEKWEEECKNIPPGQPLPPRPKVVTHLIQKLNPSFPPFSFSSHSFRFFLSRLSVFLFLHSSSDVLFHERDFLTFLFPQDLTLPSLRSDGN
jgi:hypothetical protein